MANDEPKVKVLKKINVSTANIVKDKALKAAYEDHGMKGAELAEAIKASEEAGIRLKALLGPKLKSMGIRDETDWRLKKLKGGGLVAEIIERQTTRRRSRIETQDADF